MRVQGFIPESNLKAFLTSLSWFADYNFHPDEFRVLEYGINDTHTEKGKWYEYFFEGREFVKFRIGKDDPGTGMIELDIEAPHKMVPKIQTAIEIMEYFEVSK